MGILAECARDVTKALRFRLWTVKKMSLLAYIDPGTGLLIWQSIVAAFVGAVFYFKKTRDWLLGRIRRLFRRGGPAEQEAPASEDQPPAGS